MKEVVLEILAALPKYLLTLVALISGPKKFIRTERDQGRLALADSLIFLGISMALGFILLGSLLARGKGFWEACSPLAVLILLQVCLYSAAMWVSWRVVGGRARYLDLVSIYSYFTGPIILVLAIANLCGLGIFMTFEPVLFDRLKAAAVHPDADLSASLLDSAAYLVSVGVTLTGFVVAGTWGFIGWGAYRELAGVSRLRSTFAFFLLGLMAWPLCALAFFTARAISH